MKPILDLIVTHYNEPWETGVKFFNMLCLQRGINFSDVRVIIVQDGKETMLPWTDLLSRYPFACKVKTIRHAGVSAARNAGLRTSDAAFVMFCDFDDTFASVHSLRRFLENALPERYDLVFSHLYGETEDGNGGHTLVRYAENDTFIHGKMFRRDFLLSERILFQTGVDFAEDTLFCHVVSIALKAGRSREIPEVLYTRCWYDNSICHSEENNLRNAIGVFNSRKTLIREYYDRMCPKNYAGTVVKTAFDYYYALMCPGYPEPEYFEKDFYNFWQQYRDVFTHADDNLIAYEKDLAHREAAHKGFIRIENETFPAFVERIVNKYSGTNQKGETQDER